MITFSTEIDPAHPFAWVELFAAMTWPRDESRRREFIATWSAWAVGMIDEGRVPAASAAVRLFINDTMLSPAGGLIAAADADGRGLRAEVTAALTGPGKASGIVLTLAAQMHLHHPPEWVSLNRAIHIYRGQRALAGDPSRATGSGFKEQIWKQWRSVAPLHAAFQIIGECWRVDQSQSGVRPDICAPDELRQLLSWAEWLRIWATTFVPVRSHGTLIPAGQVLQVRCKLEPVEPPLGPLAPQRALAAEGFRKE